jgi:hypothetical protein
MRKNVLLRILLIAVPFAMLFSSCNKKDVMSLGEPQKVDLVFQANLTKPALKAANLPYDDILSKLDCSVEDYGTIHVRIATAAEIAAWDGTSDPPGTDYYLSYTKVGEGVASDLLQLIPETYYLTRFEVGTGTTASDFKCFFATPMKGSAFEDFVTDELPFEFEVGDYTKNRVLMDILCFNQQIAPAFGFAWFDYNIVEGDQICVFVNCVNKYDRINYHQVLAADMYAWKTVDGVNPSGDAPYWVVGPNYTIGEDQLVASVIPKCFPLYDVLENLDYGVFLQIKPVFGKTFEDSVIYGDDVIVHIPFEIIEQYLGLIAIPDPNPGVSGGQGVTVTVETADGPQDGNPRYIHIELEDCHKPAYFESHSNGTDVADIYALRFVDDHVEMTKILDFTSVGRDPHIAVAPNRRELYVIDSDHSDQILLYDLYSMSSVMLPVSTDPPTPDKITQLVFKDDTLFAADMGTDKITFYVLNVGPPAYYSKYAEIPLSGGVIPDFSGGDLIATDAGTLLSFSKNGSSSYVFEINTTTGTVTELANEAGMHQVFGAMVYEDNATIITGDGDGATGLESWSWTWNGTPPPPVKFVQGTTYTPEPPLEYLYGDLASPFVLTRPTPAP